jgi:hypothetical protein
MKIYIQIFILWLLGAICFTLLSLLGHNLNYIMLVWKYSLIINFIGCGIMLLIIFIPKWN